MAPCKKINLSSFYFNQCRVCMHVHVHTCTHVAIHTCERGYVCVSVHMEITGQPHVSVVTVHLICDRVSVFLLHKQGWTAGQSLPGVSCLPPRLWESRCSCRMSAFVWAWGSNSGTHIYVASAFDPLIFVAFYFSPLPHPPF